MKSIHSRRSAALRQLLIAARKASGLSQEELAQRLKSTQSAVSKIERGERRLDVVEFLNWCDAIGVDPEKIIRGMRRPE
jgi:transcriptional regulator with XRE-family HTH domain